MLSVSPPSLGLDQLPETIDLRAELLDLSPERPFAGRLPIASALQHVSRARSLGECHQVATTVSTRRVLSELRVRSACSLVRAAAMTASPAADRSEFAPRVGADLRSRRQHHEAHGVGVSPQDGDIADVMKPSA